MNAEFPATRAEAMALQHRLAGLVRCQDELGPVSRLAGVDVSSQRGSPLGWAAIVVLEWPSLRVIETAGAIVELTVPYIPGLLSFRELPAILEAWKHLSQPPELVVVDGHGRAHPRRLGIASHLGVLLDLPTIGAAKSRLIGWHADPGPALGDRVPLIDRDEEIGTVLRTKRNSLPLYVSCGHRLSTATAVEWVLATLRGYRLPEPTRLAHLASNQLRTRGRIGELGR